MTAPWPLEPGPEELEAQTRMVADFVLAQLRGLAEAPSFDLDGAEALRASFVTRPARAADSAPAAARALEAGDREELQHGGSRVPRLHPRRRRLRVGARRFHRLRREPLHGRRAGGARPRPDRGNVGRLAVPAHGPAARGARHPDVGRVARQLLGRGHGAPRAARRDVPGRRPLLLGGDALLRREGRAPCGLSARQPARAADRCPLPPAAGGARRSHPRGPRSSAGGRSWWWPTSGPPTPARSTRCRSCSTSRASTACGCTRTRPTAASSASRSEGAALLAGLERCDSITLDPHKGLFLPYGLGALLVRDGDALARVHREGASYVQDVTREGALGFADLSPELSRDFRGLRLWLPLDAPRAPRLPRAARREARARPLGVPRARERRALRAPGRAAALGRRVSAARARGRGRPAGPGAAAPA